MALTATLHHLEIALSDTDRGVYESLDLRAARHPSETLRYLVTRTLALCLFWEDGIAFSRGLSTTDEPAVWAREPDGRVRLWIDLGSPSAERIHKASKTAERVVVFTYPDFRTVLRNVAGQRVHRAERIELVHIAEPLVDALADATDAKRQAEWEVVHTGGRLYVTIAGRTHEGDVERRFLGDDGDTDGRDPA
jgi:uncharacterized protein YaeQ